jgi:hypothetical protein
MTASEMIQAIGQRCLVQCQSLHVTCQVLGVKHSYGKPRLLICPVDGQGSQWVEMSRVNHAPHNTACIDLFLTRAARQKIA